MRGATAADAAGRLEIADSLVVNRLGFGSLHISGPGMWGPPSDPAAARALLRRAVELGIEFIDTADTYGGSEEMIAEALHPYPPGLVIATKGGLERDGPQLGGFKPWRRNGRPDHIKRACESSLRRLRVDCIELYQLHSPDPDVPLVDSLGALTELQIEGKIRFIGVSQVSPGELEVALANASVVSVQNRYSIGDRENEEVLSSCEQRGLVFIPWEPLGGAERPYRHAVVSRIAGRHGASEIQVAIAWLLQRSRQMLPIPGTSSPVHLEENVASAALVLDDDDLAELDALA